MNPSKEKKMKFKIIMIIMIMGFALGGFGSAFGSTGYLGTFNTTNGTAYNCGVCHTTPTGSSSARNPFGADWANASLGNHSYTITTALANRDSDGDGYLNGAEILAKTNPGDAASFPTGGTVDTILPVVSVFTIPSSSSSLVVPISAIAATDNVGVTGYLINESPTKPAAGNWPATAPTSFTFASAGTKTLYAWVRDAAGNVSNSLSRNVTITSGNGNDVESPEVMEFTLPLTSTSLTVPILAFRAIDNVQATAYLITTTPAEPAANAAGWSADPPTQYTFSSGGAKTLYGWAKDAAGNISESMWDNVDITNSRDQTPPVVRSFRVPGTSRSLTVPILQFTAWDNTAVTGYLLTTTSIKPGPSDPKWSAHPPTAFTFTSTGRKRLYPWAKDAAGNVSNPRRYSTVNVSGNDHGGED
jgi:hypothetical protein